MIHHMKKNDLAIIGAGPAGIMAAITASKNNQSVVLIDRNQVIGRKILATGNGRCNITNRLANPLNYHGADFLFIQKVLKNFDQFDTISFFENLGLVLKEEDSGRMFPRTNQATTVVDALEHELVSLGVSVKLNSLVRSIKNNGQWEIFLENKETIMADKLILALGGQAACHLGSSGDGYYWAKNLGHTIVPIYPALVPIETIETWPREVQGLKVEAKVTGLIDGEIIREKEGDVLFTHFGLSGPAAMAEAGAVGQAVGNKKAKIILDLFPDKSIQELDDLLKKSLDVNGAKQIKNTLAGFIPLNLCIVIMNNLDINPDKKTAEITKEERQKIIQALKRLTLNVKSLRPFKEAQVTSGGISTEEIDPETMESKIIKGLYFAGEIMDVDGDSGGFNLQWAWSTGYTAGLAASKSSA